MNKECLTYRNLDLKVDSFQVIPDNTDKILIEILNTWRSFLDAKLVQEAIARLVSERSPEKLDSYYFEGFLNEKKVKNAIAEYGQDDDRDVLIQNDSSMFLNGKKGFLLTTKYFYHNTCKKMTKIPLEDITSLEVDIGLLGNHLIINNERVVIDLTKGDTAGVDLFINILKYSFNLPCEMTSPKRQELTLKEVQKEEEVIIETPKKSQEESTTALQVTDPPTETEEEIYKRLDKKYAKKEIRTHTTTVIENKDSPVDEVVKFFIQPIVFIEYCVIFYSLHGIDNGWGIGLTLLVVPIVIAIKPLYIASFIALSSYATFFVARAPFIEGQYGASFLMGLIAMVLLLSIHMYAFLNLEIKKKITAKDIEAGNEDDESKSKAA